MPISELLSTLSPFFNGAGIAVIFAALFIWLFIDTRKETADREKQVRIDTAEREELVRKDREYEQAKSESRELWFRQTIEKWQVTEATQVDVQRRTLDKLDSMDKRVERIESALSAREVSRKGA
jgi:hypothetical protein